MRKKLLFLAVALAVCGAPLTSCQKDEPTPADLAKENVAGTEWIGLNNFNKPMELKFKSDGTFSLDIYDSALSYAKGTYKQDGTTISFNVEHTWAVVNDFTTGTISYGGMSLTIPMYAYDGSKSYDAVFTLNIHKKD